MIYLPPDNVKRSPSYGSSSSSRKIWLAAFHFVVDAPPGLTTCSSQWTPAIGSESSTGDTKVSPSPDTVHR
jgi:hypothetical protein